MSRRKDSCSVQVPRTIDRPSGSAPWRQDAELRTAFWWSAGRTSKHGKSALFVCWWGLKGTDRTEFVFIHLAVISLSSRNSVLAGKPPCTARYLCSNSKPLGFRFFFFLKWTITHAIPSRTCFKLPLVPFLCPPSGLDPICSVLVDSKCISHTWFPLWKMELPVHSSMTFPVRPPRSTI